MCCRRRGRIDSWEIFKVVGVWQESILTGDITITFTPKLSPLFILQFYIIARPESTSSRLLTSQDVKAAIL